MAAPSTRRTLLGSSRGGLSSFQRVYRTADAIEVDEIEGTDVTCRRVLLDEVLLVTLHRGYGLPFVLTMLVVATVFGSVGALLAIADWTVGLGWLALTTLPPVVALALRFALGVDVVTVFGRRTAERIPFWFRKAAARDVFRLVCGLARERQQRPAREVARARPAPPLATPSPPGPDSPA